MIKVKDLQFPRYFLSQEIDIPSQFVEKILNIEVNISNTGTPDSVELKSNQITICQPSDITKFLFLLLYKLIQNYVPENYQKDKFALGLLFECKDYTYSDYDKKQIVQPVVLSIEKIPIQILIIKEIIEPLLGKIELLPVMFMPNSFIDSSEIIESSEKFSRKFNKSFNSVSIYDYPFVLVNSSIYNEASQMSHLLFNIIKHNFGEEKTNKIIKNLLLDKDKSIISNILTIIKILEGDPIFIIDFLKFLQNNVSLNQDEETQLNSNYNTVISSDNYLNKHIKTSGSSYTPGVFKQWNQWSMIMGLIEKQLEPMRGSMWPASKNIKPTEDKHRLMAIEKAKKKGKNQLNFEELLEVSRDWYQHKAVQPGQLIEVMLKENRVWK